MYKETDAVGASRLLNTSTDDWCDYLEDKYKLDPLELSESGITVDQAEAKIDVSGDFRRAVFDRGQPFYITGTQVRFHVPFSGDKDLLQCRSTAWTTRFPAAVIRDAELVYETADHDREAVKRQFEQDLALTRQWMGWVNSDIAQFNGKARDLARKHMENRKAKLLKDQGMVVALGYPLRRREDVPTTYAAPVVRKKLVEAPTVKPGTPPFVSEPSLEMARYEEILATLNSMVTAMERSPSTFSHMDEEQLRDFFLVQLNALYEGRATGETFNFEGKTDILIRDNEKNIFIAECKFWKGPASLSGAIDQLLGYASWRDTKTAILLFNRARQFSTVLEKIPGVVTGHSAFKRELGQQGESQFRYILKHRDDPNRELVLAVMAFEVPA
jgi:hypothetical protein